ncbi:hypothetical protein PENTCL1PPCAC_29643, partial [Pristionchus entomophagus]
FAHSKPTPDHYSSIDIPHQPFRYLTQHHHLCVPMAPPPTAILRRSARRAEIEENLLKEASELAVTGSNAPQVSIPESLPSSSSRVVNVEPSSSPPPRRASSRIADRKAQLPLQSAREDHQCSICFLSMRRGAVRLDCSHCFHQRCVTKWLAEQTRRNQTCPLCRRIPKEMKKVQGGRKVALPTPKDDFVDFHSRMFEFVQRLELVQMENWIDEISFDD